MNGEWFHPFLKNLWVLFQYAVERSISFNLLISVNFMGNIFLRIVLSFSQCKKRQNIKGVKCEGKDIVGVMGRK